MDKHMAERLARAAYNINVVQKRNNEEAYKKCVHEIKQIFSRANQQYEQIKLNYKIGKLNKGQVYKMLSELRNDLNMSYNNISSERIKAEFSISYMLLIDKIDTVLGVDINGEFEF